MMNSLRARRTLRWVAVGLMPGTLVLAACTAGPATVAPTPAAQQAAPLNVIRQYTEGATTSVDAPVAYVTVNVEVTEVGYEPATVVVPAGRRVQLVFRNMGTAEYHFRVLGLVPEGLVFLATEDDEAPAAAPSGLSESEHAMHHAEGGQSFVPSRTETTPAGVRVTGDRVHAWAPSDGIDKVIFTAPSAGTFGVSDPRHPGIAGKLIVQ